MISNFRLTIDGEIYKSSEISNELITSSLLRPETEFVVLEPEKPIKNSIYLQFAGVVEIRILPSYREMVHYSYIPESNEELVKIFLDYYNKNEIPNVRNWKDITASFQPNLLKRILGKIKFGNL